MWSESRRAALLRNVPILLLLAFFGALYAQSLSSFGMFTWDGAEYASIGRSVLRGGGFSLSGHPNPLRPPVLPLVAAASMLATGSASDLAVKAPIVAFSLFALWLVYYATAVEVDRLTGLVAAAFLGCFPTFWELSAHFLSEVPFLALFGAAVLSFYFGLYRRPSFLYASWLCFALALLTRYTGVLFMPVAAALTIVALLAGDPAARARAFSRSFLLSPLAALALLLPWLARQQATFGDALVGFKLASTQIQLYLPDVSLPWYSYGVQLPGILSPFLAAVLASGVVWILWRRNRFGLHCFLVLLVLLSWFSCYRYKEARLITSALPFMAIVAALPVTQLFARARPPARWGIALGLVALAGALTLPNTRRNLSGTITLGYPSFLSAMRFLHGQTQPDALVLGANYPQIHWYADRRAEDLPPEERLPRSLDQVDWVVLTNFERGQKEYAKRILKSLRVADLKAETAVVFRDPQFSTVLVRSQLVRERLYGD